MTGAEAALAFGRRRLIAWAAWGSVALGLALGLAAFALCYGLARR